MQVVDNLLSYFFLILCVHNCNIVMLCLLQCDVMWSEEKRWVDWKKLISVRLNFYTAYTFQIRSIVTHKVTWMHLVFFNSWVQSKGKVKSIQVRQHISFVIRIRYTIYIKYKNEICDRIRNLRNCLAVLVFVNVS